MQLGTARCSSARRRSPWRTPLTCRRSRQEPMHTRVNGTGCPLAAGGMCSGVSAIPRRASLRPAA
eukprot:89972-Prymnesium_polylepis.1